MSGPRTFYLAAASASVETAKACIADLESRGMECLYNWTALDKPESEWREVAEAELRAVEDADLFVAVAPMSPGAGWEGGYRLGTWAPIHLVGSWVCPFAHLRAVVRHADWSSFLASLGGGQ